MNGIKHDTPHAASAAANAPSNLSEKALPPIQGALHSAQKAAKDAVGSARDATSSSSLTTEYPVPQSHPDSQIADYVLVFQHIAKKYLRSSTKVPAAERSKIAAELAAPPSARPTGGALRLPPRRALHPASPAALL
ncbi:hypothetical protein L1887_42327 [Cichorium endivia]|nr:hypothetical protein L1887_42327 [Cichorium endivia]